MGLIRLLLAIAVIIGHSNPIFGLSFIGAQLAVEVFFIISGFYMALILSEKYTHKSHRVTFFTNRLLKIFPIYWVVLILSLIYEILNSYFHTSDLFPFTDPTNHLNLFLVIMFILNNIFIFGQDILLFLGINTSNGTLFFTPNFRQHQPPLYDFMLIPQAWSLALELVFYLIAPFLIKLKSRMLLIIMALSLILRLYIYRLGFNNDPWTYRFFPNEIFFFIAGIMAYRIYRRIKNRTLNKNFLNTIFALYVLFLASYQFIPHNTIKQFSLFLSTILLLPFIFYRTKSIKFDSFIGELSYPIYISHFLIINTLTHFTNISHQYLGVVATIISITLSIFLVQTVIKPIDRFRQKRLHISNV